MTQTLAGMKIRALRRRRGLTQGELARRAGISPSYLNLIEFNKRSAAGALLGRIAAGLGVERSDLDGEVERQLVESLDEIASDPVLGEGAAERAPAADLVGRHPGWADLVLRLYQAWLDERQAVLALADRLNRDPFLGASVHSMLSNVTAIRSAAEILRGGDDLRPADRDRFLSIIAGDSGRLSETAKSLLAFFDNANMRVRSATPMEHVDAFIFETDNHFPELEALAEEVARDGGADAAASRLGADAGSPTEAAETRRFRAARTVSLRVGAGAVEAIVADHPALGSDEARALAAAALHSYAAAAMLMPYEPFLEAAERLRYDVDQLCRLFAVSYEQAAHRLATLRRPGAEGIRFAFMRSDPSGYVTKRLPLPRLPLPRYGTACPLWPVYGAFQTPGLTMRSFGELPSGDQFLFFARAVEKRPPAARSPRHLLSVMLACSAIDADRVACADGIDRSAATMPVGTVCRVCPRTGCGHRQEAPLIA